MQEREDD